MPTKNCSLFKLNLNLFSNHGPLLSDDDNDGYPEHLNMTLGTAATITSGEIWAGIINLAARLNIESCGPGIQINAIHPTEKSNRLVVENPVDTAPWAACLEKTHQGAWRLSGHHPRAMGQILDTLATAAISPHSGRAVRFELLDDRSLEGRVYHEDGSASRFSLPDIHRETPASLPAPPEMSDLTSLAQFLLPATENDPRGTRLALTLALPRTLSHDCGLALFTLVGRASSRATELHLPLAHVGNAGSDGVCLDIQENDQPDARMTCSNGKLTAVGGTPSLPRLIRELTRLRLSHVPLRPNGLNSFQMVVKN